MRNDESPSAHAQSHRQRHRRGIDAIAAACAVVACWSVAPVGVASASTTSQVVAAETAGFGEVSADKRRPSSKSAKRGGGSSKPKANRARSSRPKASPPKASRPSAKRSNSRRPSANRSGSNRSSANRSQSNPPSANRSGSTTSRPAQTRPTPRRGSATTTRTDRRDARPSGRNEISRSERATRQARTPLRRAEHPTQSDSRRPAAKGGPEAGAGSAASRPDYRFGYDSTKAREGRPDYRFSYDRNRRIDRSERTKRDFDRDRRPGRHGADYDKRRPGNHSWNGGDKGNHKGKDHGKGHYDHKGHYGGKNQYKKVVKNYYYGGSGYGGYGYWWRPYRSYCPTFSLGYSGYHDGLSFSIGLGASYWDDWCSFTYGPSYGYSYSRPYYTSSASTVVVIDDREPDVVYTPGSSTQHVPDLTVGWEHLATGRDEEALQYFSNRVQRWGDSADAKVGYALAAAQQNDQTRAVWSMRRAFRIDDGSLGYLPLDSRLYSLVELYESRFVYEAERSTGRQQRDALFMVAALRFILHDMPGALDAATEAQRLGDHDTSVLTLIANAEAELGN